MTRKKCLGKGKNEVRPKNIRTCAGKSYSVCSTCSHQKDKNKLHRLGPRATRSKCSSRGNWGADWCICTTLARNSTFLINNNSKENAKEHKNAQEHVQKKQTKQKEERIDKKEPKKTLTELQLKAQIAEAKLQREKLRQEHEQPWKKHTHKKHMSQRRTWKLDKPYRQHARHTARGRAQGNQCSWTAGKN